MRESARFAAVRSLAYGCALLVLVTPAGHVFDGGIRIGCLALMGRI